MKAIRYAALTALTVLTACKNDIPVSADEDTRNDYTVNWVKTFGLIDPEQDWNMATRITAEVNPTAFGSGYVVHVYNTDPKHGGVLMARVATAQTLGLDVAEDAQSVYVRAYTPDLSAYMSAEYPIVAGKVDISAKSREEMPLSRAESNLTEPDGYQWLLACEDLGATDDYDFNDIVVGVNYVATSETEGTLTVTPLAAGGTLKAYVCYGSTELFEIHKPLNGEGDEVTTRNHTMYNTGEWKGPGASTHVEVTEGFTITENMGGIKIKVVKDETTEGTLITAPASGTAPQIICVKGDWEWPKERVKIQAAYPGFSDWSSSSKTTDWNAHKVEAHILKRINGTVNVSGEALGHEYVDLGLPSGTLWATCNVGANYPEDYGNYYSWGDTETKTEYLQDNTLTFNRTLEELRDAGIIDTNNNLTAELDAATVNWGGAWRMPTSTEMQELIVNCTWTWTAQDYVNGYKVTSKTNGNSIFLPAAGARHGTGLYYVGSSGHYWSATAHSEMNYAYGIYISSSNRLEDGNSRISGRTVRPVIGTASPTPEPVHTPIDLGLSVKWATANIGAYFPDCYGKYYAYGETETKTEYTDANCLTLGKTFDQLQAAGIIDSSNILTTAYDAACANWGSTWRMPTKAEFDELVNASNCTWEWTTQHGANGYKVTSKVEGYVGNYIFLPAAGLRYGKDLLNDGPFGRYWSATAHSATTSAYRLGFSSSEQPIVSYDYRGSGRTIRPVTE